MSTPDALLDLFVLADFAPGNSDAALSRSICRVDRDNLDEILADASPHLQLTLDGPVNAELRLRSFGDLRPERLVEEIPEAQRLLHLRHLLEDWGHGKSDPDAVQAALEGLGEGSSLAAAARQILHPQDEDIAAASESAGQHTEADCTPGKVKPDARSASDPLSSLLEMVDLDGSHAARDPDAERVPDSGQAQDHAASAARRGLDRLIREALGTTARQNRPSPAKLKPLLREVDRELACLLRAVLHHRDFQALEATWLGLRLLVRRIDFRTGIRVFLVGTTRQGLGETLSKRVAPYAEGIRDEGRVPCILADFSFGATPDALTELESVAAEAAAIRGPLVTDLAPDLLGITSLAELGPLPNLDDLLAGPAYDAWQGLRATDASRWLSLGMNRFLLRFPYGKESNRVKGFPFEENELGQEAHYLFGRTPWLQGTLIAGSFTRTGWGVDCIGGGTSGTLEDLPVRPLKLATGEIVQAPLETLLPENRVLQLSQAGIVAPACRRNSDAAFVITAPTVYRPKREEDEIPGRSMAEEGRRATLPYQLFLAQVGSLLESVWRNLDPARAPEELAHTLVSGLEFLTASAEGPTMSVEAEVPSAPGGPGRNLIGLRITPVGWPLRGLPAIALELPLPTG